MEKKSRVTLFIIILSIILILTGVSFAFFTAKIDGSESTSTIVADSGHMTIVYDNGSGNITAHNLAPDNAAFATKTFTLTGTNTTNKTMPYTLTLIIDNNTFSTNTISYTLTSTNTGTNGTIVPSIATQTPIATGTSTITLGTGTFVLADTKVHTYVLSLYFIDTGSDQSTDMSKYFAAHIGITAGQSY